MRKESIKTLLIGFLAFMISLPVFAYDFESGGIYYNVDGDNVSVTSGDSYKDYIGDIVIPSQVTYNGKTYSVATIGKNAFESCIGLLSVTIPSSIKIIDIDAFKNCINLTAVNTSDISSWCNINFVDHYCNPLLLMR